MKSTIWRRAWRPLAILLLLALVAAPAIQLLSGSAAAQAPAAPSAANTSLVNAGSIWKYLVTETDPDTAWSAQGFDDSKWTSGYAPLGYGTHREATAVSFGPDSRNKYITTYFRRVFNVTNPSQFTSLTLSVARDDGAVIYLNGVEIWRTNMPAGTVTYQTLALSDVSNSASTDFYTASGLPNLLVPVSNTLAVEVHQASASSKDLWFDLSLAGDAAAPPPPDPPTATATGTGTPVPSATSTGTSTATATSTSTATATSTPTATATSTRTPTATPTSSGPDVQPSLPLRAAFYYPWFPEAWNQQGFDPFTNYHPSLGYYDSSSTTVIKQHIDAMQYGGIAAGIASWWGQGSETDKRMPTLLANTAGSTFRWTIYYEPESLGDPSSTAIASDLAYLSTHYGKDPSYLRINGRFVVFVYASGTDACAMADRWKAGNATANAYIVLKVFAGYQNCASQPDGWHQYGPATATDAQGSYSYTISPGFYKPGETGPRLARDPARWQQNVLAMVASGATFQLITTFNEWGEGTSVEPATEWVSDSTSSYGAYLDVLHANGTGEPPPIPTDPPGTCSGTLTKGPTLILTGSNTEMKVVWQWSDNSTFNVHWGTDTSYAQVSPDVTAYDPTNYLYAYTITGLTPGTKYFYQVVTNGHCASSTFYAPPPDSATAVKFVAYGDTRSQGAVHDGLAAQIVSLFKADPAFQTLNLNVGDWVSGDTSTAWDTEWFASGYASIRQQDASIADTGVRGNHESGAIYWQRYFPQPYQPGGLYRSFDYGPMHIAMLDQYVAYNAGSTQYNWLKNDLAASTKTWKLVVLHEPGWSSGGGHGDNTTVQNDLEPLFRQYGVSIVFGGHNHYYARATVDNIQHLTVGGGGAPLYSPQTKNYPAVVTRSQSYSFGQFSITGNTLVAKVVNDSGTQIETFTITR